MTVVGVVGSYGGLNLGDEAILACVLGCIERWRPGCRVIVLSRDPEHTRTHHRVAEVVPWRSGRARALGAVEGLDALVLGGGGILYDGQARSYLRWVREAQGKGVPTFAYAIGAGPLHEREDRTAAREAMEALTELTVRDEESQLVLEDVGVTRPMTVTADPAFLLEPEPFTGEMLMCEGIPAEGPLIGVSVREPGRAAEHLDVDSYHALMAEMGDYLVRRLDAHLVFVPIEADDVRHAHAVLAHMTAPNRGRILHGTYRPERILDLMRRFDLAVGMRLHFLMFAAMAGVPPLPLPYAGKVFDFAQAAGAPALTGVAREVAGPLLAEVDRLWDERPARQRDLEPRIRELKRRAVLTCELFGTFINAIDS